MPTGVREKHFISLQNGFDLNTFATHGEPALFREHNDCRPRDARQHRATKRRCLGLFTTRYWSNESAIFHKKDVRNTCTRQCTGHVKPECFLHSGGGGALQCMQARPVPECLVRSKRIGNIQLCISNAHAYPLFKENLRIRRGRLHMNQNGWIVLYFCGGARQEIHITASKGDSNARVIKRILRQSCLCGIHQRFGAQ